MFELFEVLDRLSTRWTAIENANLSGEDAAEQEILENTSLRLLSKDYIDFIYKLLEAKSQNGIRQTSCEDVEADAMMGKPAGQEVNNSRNGSCEDLGEFGLILLDDPTCFQSIIHLCIQYKLTF